MVNSSRCTCKTYDRAFIPEVPGADASGKAIQNCFHDRGLHWDFCKQKGGLIARYNDFSHALADGLRKLGYSVTVAEVQLGVSDRNKGGNGKPQRGDWYFIDWQHGMQRIYRTETRRSGRPSDGP